MASARRNVASTLDEWISPRNIYKPPTQQDMLLEMQHSIKRMPFLGLTDSKRDLTLFRDSNVTTEATIKVMMEK